MTEVTLSNQRRVFQKNLTLSEQKDMEIAIKSELESESDLSQNEGKSKHDNTKVESSLDCLPTVEKEDNDTMKGRSREQDESSNKVDENNNPFFQQLKNDFMTRLVVGFDEVKTIQLIDRPKLRTLKMTVKNKENLKAMNEVLTEFLLDKTWDLNALNALHYSAARILAGECKPPTP